MTTKREEADLQFARATRKSKAGRTESKSRSIIEQDRAQQDLKTAELKRQREERDARESGKKAGDGHE